MAEPLKIKPSPQIARTIKLLTDGTMTKWSSGRIPKLTREQAIGFTANLIQETGSADLTTLDVVERGSAEGRGAGQFTGARRQAYDQWASKYPNRNNPDAQLQYMAKEYRGDYDPNGNSLVGYTKSFEQAPKGVSPQDAALYFSRTYFRPGEPHNDRRVNYAQQLDQAYPIAAPKPKPMPKPQIAAKRQSPLKIFGITLPFQ
jgi:hypothetical protein